MANYYESARTNYFRVKDVDAFKKFVDSITSVDAVQNDDKSQWAVLFTEDGVPNDRYIEATDEYEEFDFMAELATHLADDEVAILMSSGAEKLRYVSGQAVAINNRGESVSISLNDIYVLAEKLGKNISKAEY